MKITCNSCGSKYNIADAKVRGKKVKVRCKGCKESILVDGTNLDSQGRADALGSEPDTSSLAPASISPSSAPPPSLSGAGQSPSLAPAMPPRATSPNAEIWSVNLTDDDSREMTLGELVDAWKSGVVTHDAYVWKDGMGDWKPILEVGELKLKLGTSAQRPGIVTSTGPSAPSAGKMDDLFGSASAAGDESNPLFGVLGEPEAEKATGARNDSSVLFSLDSLKSAAPATQERANPNELFGSLDAGAGQLGASVDLLAAPAKAPPQAPAGGRAVGMAGAPEAGREKGKKGLIFALLGVVALAGAAFFFMGNSADSDAAAVDEKLKAAQAKIEATEKKAEEEKKKAEKQREKMEADLKKAREAAEAKGEKAAEASTTAEKKEAEKAVDEKKAQSASSGEKAPSSGSSKPQPKKTEKVGGFNKSAAKSSLSRAASIAASCSRVGSMTGSGKVRVTFSTSGRVTSSTVISGPLRGTTVGGCVASTFRRARIPKFSGSPVTVSKSFRVK